MLPRFIVVFTSETPTCCGALVSFVETEGAQLYWSSYGNGDPVLLIMGLSFTHEMWFRLLPAFTTRYRAVVFDNRGMGRSSVPMGSYGIPLMARDALAVMNASGIDRAHIVGASMGGMIAQELALQHRDRVRSLILGCTSHSGLWGRWPDLRTLPLFRNFPALTRIERERALIPLLYATTTPRDRIEEDIQIRAACNWSADGFRRQFTGLLLWTSYRRLPNLRIPTLVVHGDQDRLVPVQNGQVIARRIPGARFELIRDAGHVMTTDQPEACSRVMMQFLEAQSAATAATRSSQPFR